jgi:hypothetical protein
MLITFLAFHYKVRLKYCIIQVTLSRWWDFVVFFKGTLTVFL